MIRDGLHDHPQMAAALLLPIASLADSSAVKDLQALIISALRDMGLEGRELVVQHRILDSYVFGVSTFDFSGAPDHLLSRRDRITLTDDPAFVDCAQDDAMVDDVNEQAFLQGLNVLLDACEMAGQATKVLANSR